MPVHDWTRVDAGTFHSFHVLWLGSLSIGLNRILPPEYYALPERRALGYEADVLTLGRGTPTGNGAGGTQAAAEPTGGVRLTTADPAIHFTASRPSASRHRAIVVRRASNDRVVAVIEVVSPGNKDSGHAIRAFVAKTADLLERGIHLLMVDLFPPTPRDPRGIHEAIWGEPIGVEAAPMPNRPLTMVTYAAGEEERALVRLVAVGEALPDMPLFLAPDFYVPVPLESTYMAAFEGFPRRWRDVLTLDAGGPAHGT
jgi:Protein of unknown function (DUF4058)